MSFNFIFFKHFSKLFFLLFSTIILAQNSFQKGSYVNESGIKAEGYIYYSDWQNNPSSIEFKTSLETSSEIIALDHIQEFELTGICKYVKFEGLIDNSSNKLDELDFNRNPNWKQSSVLLKVLIESDASLFYYSTNQLHRFFYSVASKNLRTQQLVYKEFYKDGSRTENGTNFEFRQQLVTNLVCDSLRRISIGSLKYNKNDLVNYFSEYNTCKGVIPVAYNAASKSKSKINYSFLVGVSSVNFETKSNNTYANENQLFDFDNALCYRFGGEIEVILPINNSKWSIYFQPIYQSFNSDKVIDGMYGPLEYSIDYRSLNLPLGLRHYMFLSPKSKIYLGGAIGFNFDLGSKVTLGNDGNFDFFSSAFGTNFGLGYVFNEKYCFEMRYNYSFDVIQESVFQSSISDLGFVFKYKFN